ncbi:MAG: UTP--glucose-1-phosphate uridylyltransferase GalU [Mycoplasmatales bacterium]
MIKKAVIPVAGFGTRFLPFTKAMPKEMLPIVDKPTIQYIVEEAVKSGIEEIIFVTASHSNKRAIEDHFDVSSTLEMQLREKGKNDFLAMVQDISNLANVHYIRQKEAKGLGHAILCAKAFVGNEPFAVLLGDDLVVGDTPSMKQLIDAYDQTKCSIMGVQEVSYDDVDKYGVVALEKNEEKVEKMTDFVEKPKKEVAPSNRAVLGRYVLTPTIFKYLENQEAGVGNEIQLTDAVKRMMSEEDVYACTFTGRRYDIGDKLGFLIATVDFALENKELNEDFRAYLKTLF